MAVGIIRTNWSGTTGGPGLTQIAIAETTSGGSGSFFTASNVQTAVNAMKDFWAGLTDHFPDEIQLTVSPTVDIYNEIDGKLIGSITAASAPTTVTGISVGSYSMASGVKANLLTSTIRNGRRVRGAVFLVPAAGAAFTTGGVVGSTVKTDINTKGAAFKAAIAVPLLKQVVYSRPVYNSAGVRTRDGALAEVSSWSTSSKGAVLRGRRD